MSRLRSVAAGCERLSFRAHTPRHHHAEGYATIVLSGAFQEASYCGRVRVTEGDVLVHAALDAHADAMRSNGAWLLRLPWDEPAGVEGAFRIEDVDAIVKAARRDPRAALATLRSRLPTATRAPAILRDWPDRLAADLAASPSLSLSRWAREHRLTPETVSRGFRDAYDVRPSVFRWQLRARRAWRSLVMTRRPLVEIALDAGFADQAHLSRAVRALTGVSPSGWRARRDDAPIQLVR